MGTPGAMTSIYSVLWIVLRTRNQNYKKTITVIIFIAEDDQKEKGLKIASTLQLKCLGKPQFFS